MTTEKKKHTNILTKDEIFGAKDIHIEYETILEWGGTVPIRVIPGFERDLFENWCFDRRKGKNKVDTRGLKVKLIVLAVVNPDGSRMFNDADQVELNKKSGAALDKLFQAVQKVNGMTAESVDDEQGN